MTAATPRFGLCFDGRNPPPFHRPWPAVYSRVIELAQLAEANGLDMVWLSEHHQFEDGYLPQPLTMAAAIAAATHRIGLGTAVALAPLKHPRHLAEESVVVDLVSNGRFELGLGAGYREAEFEAFEVGYTDRFTRSVAVAAEVQRLWRTDILPRPTRPELPLWLGFNGPRGAEAAGRLGAGLITTEPELLDIHRSSLAVAMPGATPRVAAMARLFLADDPPAAWARLAPHVLWQWNSYRRAATDRSGRSPRPLTADDVALVGHTALTPEGIASVSRHGLAGVRFATCTVDQAATVVSELAAHGATDVLTFGWIAGAPDDLTERHLELFATLRVR